MKEWIKKSLSESNDAGYPSIKRQVLAFAVLFTASIVTASFVTGKEISQTIVTLLQTLLLAGGISYTVGRFSENKVEKEEEK